jgi:hypothetical protein
MDELRPDQTGFGWVRARSDWVLMSLGYMGLVSDGFRLGLVGLAWVKA